MSNAKPNANPPDPNPTEIQFGPGVAPTFLYYFSATALLFTLVAAKGLGVSIRSEIPQQVGLLGGLLAGVVGAYFNRTIVRAFNPMPDKTLPTTLVDVLSRMGYQLAEEVEGVQVYERSGLSRLFSGRVFVQREGQGLRVAGRSLQVKAIQTAMQALGALL